MLQLDNLFGAQQLQSPPNSVLLPVTRNVTWPPVATVKFAGPSAPAAERWFMPNHKLTQRVGGGQGGLTLCPLHAELHPPDAGKAAPATSLALQTS